MKLNTNSAAPIAAAFPAGFFSRGGFVSVRFRPQCLQTIASSRISSAQNGHFFIVRSPFIIMYMLHQSKVTIPTNVDYTSETSSTPD